MYLTSTSNLTVQFSSNLPTPSESIFIVRPHTVARTITLARAASPNDFATFEATGIVAPANTTVTLTVPANAAFRFRTKVVSNLGNAAVVYVVEQGGSGGAGGAPGDGTITPIKFAITTPTTIVADVTLDATYHMKDCVIAASISPKITLPALTSGLRCRIIRPASQPSPIFVPPTTNDVEIAGPMLGQTRLWPGGCADITYINSRAHLYGDLQWGGDLTTADVTGIVDLVDLRRGEGLTAVSGQVPPQPGDEINIWASVGAGTLSFTQATAARYPLLEPDGTLKFDTTAAQKWLQHGTAIGFAGNVIIIGALWRTQTFVPAADVFTWNPVAPDTANLIRVRHGSATQISTFITSAASNAGTTHVEGLSGQWVAYVIAIDRSSGRVWIMTNSRATTTPGLNTFRTGITTAIPNWTTLTATPYLGRKSAGSLYFLAAVRMYTNADAAVVASSMDRDVMERVLGGLRAQLPPGVEG